MLNLKSQSLDYLIKNKIKDTNSLVDSIKKEYTNKISKDVQIIIYNLKNKNYNRLEMNRILEVYGDEFDIALECLKDGFDYGSLGNEFITDKIKDNFKK